MCHLIIFVLKYFTTIQILPLSVLFTLMVGTNNLCLKYVGVAFYYVGRSLTTVFNVILTYVLLKQKTSFACIMCCAGIVGGFMLGVDQESLTESFSWKGTIFGVLGSLALALYSIHTKKALHHVNQEVWLLSYYNNLYSSILFLPLIILNGELEAIITYDKIFEFWFVVPMIAGGICGFAIGFVTALQIKVSEGDQHHFPICYFFFSFKGNVSFNTQYFWDCQSLRTNCDSNAVV